MLDDKEDGTMKSWGVNGVPTVLLFSPEGKLVRRGGGDYRFFEEALRGELK
jgi:predicted DsbA family dithiol-disulfide isomerase